MKENKYDNKVFFDKYSQMDRSVRGLEGAGEWDTFRQMMPDFTHKAVLDLGCGFGWHCLYAVEQGAASAVGVDISSNMLEEAKKKSNSDKITYLQKALEDVEFPAASFDIILSSLALHYVESFHDLCRNVHHMLNQGGSFIFSVEHPIFTAEGGQDWNYDEHGNRMDWPVDNYFEEGMRKANFLGEEVVKYHRTLTSYLEALLQNGFVLKAVVEPKPSEHLLETVPGMVDELRRPMMLLISAVKA